MLTNPPPPENLRVFEVMWKNMVDPDRPWMAVYKVVQI